MHTLRSGFWTRSYFQAVLLLLITAMIIAVAYFANGQFLLLGLVPLLAFVWLWILYELRKKTIRIVIDGASILITGYYGLGKTKNYAFSEISGYSISSLSSENGHFEYLYLFAGDKRIACASGYHHRNFAEIKEKVTQLFKNLGAQPFNISTELRELFR